MTMKMLATLRKKPEAAKTLSNKTKLDCLHIWMDEKNKRCNELSNEIGSSNWLSVIPMREYN